MFRNGRDIIAAGLAVLLLAFSLTAATEVFHPASSASAAATRTMPADTSSGSYLSQQLLPGLAHDCIHSTTSLSEISDAIELQTGETIGLFILRLENPVRDTFLRLYQLRAPPVFLF